MDTGQAKPNNHVPAGVVSADRCRIERVRSYLFLLCGMRGGERCSTFSGYIGIDYLVGS
jgi:hypothetical protein